MIAGGILYLSFLALAAAMPRHAPTLLGQWATPRLTSRLRLGGWTLLLLSLLSALQAADGSRSLVTWFGLIPLAAGAVLLGLTFAPRLARAAALLAFGLVLIGSAA